MSQEGDGQGIMKRQRQMNRSLQQACLVKTVCAILLVFVQSSAFVTALVGQAGAQMARTEEMNFNIPAQPVGPAVNAFANATGWQVSFPTDLVAGFTSSGINGRFTPEAALRALLAGTGLRYQFADTHAVTLVRESPPSQQDLAPIAAKPVVVTGELQQRTVQESQTSVTIFRGEVLDQTPQFTNVKDIYNQTANVTTSIAGSNVSIRGIEALGVGGGGSGLLINVNVDGASALLSRGIAGAAYSTWDLEQVEILRGPQSTQRGRNALGGAVLVRSKDPSFKPEFKTRLDYGRFNELRAAGAVNLPLIDDRLALRVSAEQFQTDGYIENPTRGEDDYHRSELQTFRGKLRWRLTDQVDVIAGYTFSDNLFGQQTVDIGATGNARINLANELDQRRGRSDIVNVRINADFNPRWSVFSETTYYNMDFSIAWDSDGTAADGGRGNTKFDEYSITQEVRATYQGENLTGALGVYFTDTAWDSLGVGRVPGIFFRLPPETFVDVIAGGGLDATNLAFYGEVDLDLLERWTVTVGARYDLEWQDGRQNSSSTPSLPIFPTTSTQSDTNFSAFLPKGGATYHWTDEVSTGFTVQRGYRSGGSGTSMLQNYEFDAEYTWNYELAFRSTWLDQRLVANANAFYTDWTDQQVIIFGPTGIQDNITVNAGRSELFGFEVETEWQATNNLNVFANLGHTKTRFKEFLTRIGNDLVDFAGNEFGFAPEWTGSLGGAYYFDNGLMIEANGNYTDFSYNSAMNLEDAKSDSRLIFNGRVGYEGENWAIFVYGRNIFDERYFLRRLSPGRGLYHRGNLGEPAIIGFTISGNFDGLGDIVNLGS